MRTFNILLAIDGSEHSRAAASLLCDLPLPSDTFIHVVAVLIPLEAANHVALRTPLEQTSEMCQRKGVNVETELLVGYPAETLTRIAEESDPDLIVLGAKGLRSALNILLGGVAQQLVEYSNQPVLVVRPPYTGIKRVLLVTDGSAHSQLAVQYMGQFPLPSDANIHVLHVLPPLSLTQPDIIARSWPIGPEVLPPLPQQPTDRGSDWQTEAEKEGQRLLDNTIDTLKASGVQAKSVLLRGDAYKEINDYVKKHDTDLIVCGSRGLSQVQGWLLGSVSRKLVHYTGCSVLVVKGSNDTQHTT